MREIIKQLIPEKYSYMKRAGIGQAPVNIALCKYWGKRNVELNLPCNSSLSLSLMPLLTTTTLEPAETFTVYVNGQQQVAQTPFAQRLIAFLKYFTTSTCPAFTVVTKSAVPIAAGLASSAAGFAALVLALDDLFNWQLSQQRLSLLARLGSGSATRSLFPGFSIWHRGQLEDGMDSYAEGLPDIWPELRLGILLLSEQEKKISSREAMQHSVETSPFFQAWQEQVVRDMSDLKEALKNQDFTQFGEIVESNSLAMHATLQTARPAISYTYPETSAMMHQVWACREQHIPVYFTQDAGPNLKLLFLAQQQSLISSLFPNIEIIVPFDESYDVRIRSARR